MVGSPATMSSVMLFTRLAAQGMGRPGSTRLEKHSVTCPLRTRRAEISITSSLRQEMPVVSKSKRT